MAWETRRRGTRYFTRSRKIGRRVVREYVGGGLVGELAAAQDQLRRAQHAATRADWRAERARLDAAERTLTAYCRATDQLLRAELTAAGFRQHARGDWRRRRGRAE
jgi:hypothetical protein